MKRYYTIALVCFLSLTCIAQLKTNDKQYSQSELEVDSIFKQMIFSAEQLDYAALHQGVDDRYKVGFVSNSQFYEEYSTLKTTVNAGIQGVAKQTIVINKKKLSAISPDVVIVTAEGSSKVSLIDGREFTSSFHWSFVYQKIDGEWKVIQSHQSRKD